MAQSSFDTVDVFSVRTIDESEGGVRIVAEGELDLATVHQLIGALRSVEQTAAGPIVLDLGALTFMDASSLRVVLSAHRRALAADREFSVEACRGIVARVCAVTWQEAALGLEPSEAATHA